MDQATDTGYLDQMLALDPPAPASAPAPGLAFTAKKFVLRLLLERAATVVPNRDVMPVLKHFQFEVSPTRLRVVATDTELSMIATTPLVQVTQPGTAVFPARKMLDILREADDGDISVHVQAGTARIHIGRTTWNLKLLGGEDYPPLPSIAEVTFTATDRAAFAKALQAVRYAACKDANRASLMMIDVSDGRMTACDGARFQQAAVASFPFSFQIPIGAVDDLLKLLRATDLPDIHIGESPHHLIFRFGTDLFVISKLVARFPDMEGLLLRPALANRHQLELDRADLLTAVKRVRITADPETSAIGLLVAPDQLTVSARDKFGNYANEAITASWAGPGRTLVVNHAYLTDLIGATSAATLRFCLGDDTKTRKAPLLLRDDEANTIGVVQQMLGDWIGAE
jgi:DNA polymerase III subunit beta